jgi:acetyltransferase-like isoleucine patch superfamily enzyme
MPTKSPHTMLRMDGLGEKEAGASARDNVVPVAVREPKGGLYFVKIWKMNIHPTAHFSLRVELDRTHPSGIHIGRGSYVAFGAVILTHDMTRGLYADTRIGERCFIGARSILMPGVSIGDNSIVGAGSVVTRDVPPGSIVAGNPARIVRSGVKTYRFGCLWDWETMSPDMPARGDP